MRVPCWYSSTLRRTVHQEVVSGYRGAYRDSEQKVQGPLAGMLAWVDGDKLYVCMSLYASVWSVHLEGHVCTCMVCYVVYICVCYTHMCRYTHLYMFNLRGLLLTHPILFFGIASSLNQELATSVGLTGG